MKIFLTNSQARRIFSAVLATTMVFNTSATALAASIPSFIAGLAAGREVQETNQYRFSGLTDMDLTALDGNHVVNLNNYDHSKLNLGFTSGADPIPALCVADEFDGSTLCYDFDVQSSHLLQSAQVELYQDDNLLSTTVADGNVFTIPKNENANKIKFVFLLDATVPRVEFELEYSVNKFTAVTNVWATYAPDTKLSLTGSKRSLDLDIPVVTDRTTEVITDISSGFIDIDIEPNVSYNVTVLPLGDGASNPVAIGKTEDMTIDLGEDLNWETKLVEIVNYVYSDKGIVLSMYRDSIELTPTYSLDSKVYLGETEISPSTFFRVDSNTIDLTPDEDINGVDLKFEGALASENIKVTVFDGSELLEGSNYASVVENANKEVISISDKYYIPEELRSDSESILTYFMVESTNPDNPWMILYPCNISSAKERVKKVVSDCEELKIVTDNKNRTVYVRDQWQEEYPGQVYLTLQLQDGCKGPELNNEYIVDYDRLSGELILKWNFDTLEFDSNGYHYTLVNDTAEDLEAYIEDESLTSDTCEWSEDGESIIVTDTDFDGKVTVTFDIASFVTFDDSEERFEGYFKRDIHQDGFVYIYYPVSGDQYKSIPIKFMTAEAPQFVGDISVNQDAYTDGISDIIEFNEKGIQYYNINTSSDLKLKVDVGYVEGTGIPNKVPEINGNLVTSYEHIQNESENYILVSLMKEDMREEVNLLTFGDTTYTISEIAKPEFKIIEDEGYIFEGNGYQYTVTDADSDGQVSFRYEVDGVQTTLNLNISEAENVVIPVNYPGTEIEAYKISINLVAVSIDYTNLESLVNDCLVILENRVNYSSFGWDAFEDAFSEARGLLPQGDVAVIAGVTQEDITRAIEKLDKARNALVNISIHVAEIEEIDEWYKGLEIDSSDSIRYEVVGQNIEKAKEDIQNVESTDSANLIVMNLKNDKQSLIDDLDISEQIKAVRAEVDKLKAIQEAVANGEKYILYVNKDLAEADEVIELVESMLSSSAITREILSNLSKEVAGCLNNIKDVTEVYTEILNNVTRIDELLTFIADGGYIAYDSILEPNLVAVKDEVTEVLAADYSVQDLNKLKEQTSQVIAQAIDVTEQVTEIFEHRDSAEQIKADIDSGIVYIVDKSVKPYEDILEDISRIENGEDLLVADIQRILEDIVEYLELQIDMTADHTRYDELLEECNLINEDSTGYDKEKLAEAFAAIDEYLLAINSVDPADMSTVLAAKENAEAKLTALEESYKEPTPGEPETPEDLSELIESIKTAIEKAKVAKDLLGNPDKVLITKNDITVDIISEAIVKAEEAIANEEATKNYLDEVLTILTNAYQSVVDITEQTATYEALNIEYVEMSSNKDCYDQDLLAAANEAIANLRVALDNFNPDDIAAWDLALSEAQNAIAAVKDSYTEPDSGDEVDFTELEALVHELAPTYEGGNQNSEYTDSSYTKFVTAYEVALSVIENATTQELVNDAIADLTEAFNSLNRILPPENPGEGGNEGGDNPGGNEGEGGDNTGGNEGGDNPGGDNPGGDEGGNEGENEIDLSTLNSKIAEFAPVFDLGNADEVYTSESWTAFETAYNEALALTRTEAVLESQEVVDAVIAKLVAAFEGLSLNETEPEVSVNFDALEEALEEYRELFEAHNADKIYTDESFGAFECAFLAAESIIADKTETSQAVVDRRLAELVNAKNALEVYVPEVEKVDKSELESILNRYKSVYDGNNSDGKYTETSFKLFKNAYAVALLEKDSVNSTKESIDNAIKVLDSMYKQLIPSEGTQGGSGSGNQGGSGSQGGSNNEDKPASQIEINKLNSTVAANAAIFAAKNESGIYTAESYSRFEYCYEMAQAVLKMSNPSQSLVKYTMKSLEDAIKGMQLSDSYESGDYDVEVFANEVSLRPGSILDSEFVYSTSKFPYSGNTTLIYRVSTKGFIAQNHDIKLMVDDNPASGLVLDTSNITQSTGPVGDESHVDLIFKLNWTANNPVSVNTPVRLIIDGRTVHFTDLDMTILNHVDQTPDKDEDENEGSTGNEGNGSGSVGGNEGTQKPDSSKPSDKEDADKDEDKDEKPVKLKVLSLRDIGEEIEAMAKGDVLELELGDKNAISSEILNLIKDSSKTLSFVNDEADISYVWSIYGKDIRTTKFKDSSYSLLITPEDEGMFSSDLEDLLYEKCLILDFDIGSTRFTSQLAVKTDMRRKNVNIYQVIDEDEEIFEWVGKTKSSNKGTVEFETDEYGIVLLTTETLPREYVVNYEDSINYKEPSKEDQVVDSEETTDVTVGENTITLPNSVINSDGSVNIGDKTYTTEELAVALENGEITEEQIEDILDAELDGFLDMIEDLFGGLFEESSSGSSEETTVRPGGQVSNAVTGGISAQILEDRAVDESGMPIAAILAVVIFAAVSAAGVTIFIKKRSE